MRGKTSTPSSSASRQDEYGTSVRRAGSKRRPRCTISAESSTPALRTGLPPFKDSQTLLPSARRFLTVKINPRAMTEMMGAKAISATNPKP